MTADEEKAAVIVDNPCQKYGCLCVNNTVTCVNVGPDRLDQGILKLAPETHSISFSKCSQKHITLDIFENFTSLRNMAFLDCNIQQLFPSALNSLQSLRVLNMSRNYLWDWNGICLALNELPSLQIVDLSYNRFSKLSDTGHCVIKKLQHLNLSFNQVSELSVLPNAVSLDLSSNGLVRIYGEWPFSLEYLNLANNPLLERFPSLSAVSELSDLNMDNCGLTILPIFTSLNLRQLSLQYNKFIFIDFDLVNLPSLQKLDLRNNFKLHSVVGTLPAEVKDFRLTNSPMRYLPPDFFIRAKNLRFTEMMPNNWSCNNCLSKWTKVLPFKLRPQMNCTDELLDNCSVGISKRNEQGAKYILRVPYGEVAVLPCDAYGELPLSISWWLVRPEVLIGSYNFENRTIVMNWTRSGVYEIIPGGLLLINTAKKELVERYRCTLSNSNRNASQVIHFRLDYSFWFHVGIVKSVFWSTILAAVVTCGITFILNLLWITCRQVGLWWIKRIERNSQVREMVAAVERYRQRQMAALSETYHKKLEQIRDNYRQQVDQLSSSYASQSERFRDYRAAQMESMNQHLENIRDNYNQQMFKLRDYGSKRVEQLWEGYERQLNRLKMFSLHQRLGLMRKYKVKQQYLNKLVAKFADNSSETFTKPHPEVILSDSVHELNIQTHRRFGSFHSLPEHVLYGDDFPKNVLPGIQKFNDRELLMSEDCEFSHDAPCCSKQLQGKKGPKTLEVHQRCSLSNVNNERNNMTVSSNGEREFPHDDGCM